MPFHILRAIIVLHAEEAHSICWNGWRIGWKEARTVGQRINFSSVLSKYSRLGRLDLFQLWLTPEPALVFIPFPAISWAFLLHIVATPCFSQQIHFAYVGQCSFLLLAIQEPSLAEKRVLWNVGRVAWAGRYRYHTCGEWRLITHSLLSFRPHC